MVLRTRSALLVLAMLGTAVPALAQIPSDASALPSVVNCADKDGYAGMVCSDTQIQALDHELTQALADRMRSARPDQRVKLQRGQNAWVAAYPWGCEDSITNCPREAVGKRLNAVIGPPDLRGMSPAQRFAALERSIRALDGIASLSAPTVSLRQDVALLGGGKAGLAVPLGQEINVTAAQLGALFSFDTGQPIDDIALTSAGPSPADNALATHLSMRTYEPCADGPDTQIAVRITWSWDHANGAITRVVITPDESGKPAT